MKVVYTGRPRIDLTIGKTYEYRKNQIEEILKIN